MWLLILSLFLVKRSEQRLSFYEDSFEGEEGQALSCVNRIVKRHFDLEHEVTIVSQGSKDYVGKMKDTVQFIENVSSPDEMFGFSETQQAVLFLEGDFERDQKILRSVGRFHPRSRLVIACIVRGCGSSLKIYLDKVIRILHEKERWLVAVVVKTMESDIRLFGYTKSAHGNCNEPEIVEYGECSSQDNVFALFPIYSNYNQCPLRLATFDWPPFSKFSEENGRKVSKGIESNIVNCIVERVNASTHFIDVAPSGIRKILGDHEADIGWGQLALYEKIGFSYTKSYSIVQGSVLIPNRLSLTHLALSNLMPLDNTVWIALILVIFFVVILRTFVPAFKIIPMLGTVALFLGLGFKVAPLGNSQRIYFISLLLFGYIITQAYLANLTTIFMVSKDRGDINSLEALDKSTIPFGGSRLSRIFFENKYPRIYRQYQVMNLTKFMNNLERLRTGKGGLATYVEISKYINYKHWKQTTIIPEIITSYPVAMLVPNVSTILPICDWIISAIFETGLIDQWGRSFTCQQCRAEEQEEEMEMENKSKPMNLFQFTMIFKMLGIALSISTAVFVIELLAAMWKKNNSHSVIQK